MIYEIILKGPDDQTTFTIELTEMEKALVDRISELSFSNSGYKYMPTMYINEVLQEEDQ